tara:strand:- start:237 stop:845 length:609 start_codon:yes stop_codon:yes gene_type:complete
MQVKSYTDLLSLIRSLIGAGDLTTDEQSKILNFVNRRAFEAYSTSQSWARYLVIGEERTLSSGNTIPYTEGGKDNIGEFIRIHRTEPFAKNSALEYDFTVDVNGANILNITNDNDLTAFVTYKKQFSEFTDTSIDIPLEFFYFIAHSAFADFLRLESKYQDARTEEAIAQNYLAIELEKIDIRNNNNSVNKKFSTYVNRQSR